MLGQTLLNMSNCRINMFYRRIMPEAGPPACLPGRRVSPAARHLFPLSSRRSFRQGDQDMLPDSRRFGNDGGGKRGVTEGLPS